MLSRYHWVLLPSLTAFPPGASAPHEDLIGPPDLVDAMSDDVSDSLRRHDDETGVRTDGESAATWLVDLYESTRDGRLGM